MARPVHRKWRLQRLGFLWDTAAAPAWCVGDTVSVTYNVTSLCYSTSVTRSFGIAAAPAATVNAPSDSYTSSCAYADQAAVTAAYNAWLAQFSVTGSCAGTSGSYGTPPAAPAFCVGDTVSVTYTVTGTCYAGGNVTRSFGIAAAPAATVNAPSDSYTSSCAYADQAAVTAAYNAWLGQFSVTGGCAGTAGSYGTPPAAPAFCVGDTVSVTYTVTGTCYAGGNVTRSFGIAAAPAATVNAPSNSYTSSCAYADQAAVTAAYNAWLGQFSVTGGCAGTAGSYGTPPAAPAFCVGDTVSVTYTVTGTCYSGGNVTRSFGIAAAPAATVNAPSSSYTSSCAYVDQAAVTAAYNAWLSQFSVTGGCAGTSGSYGTPPAAPTFCLGDTVSVTYTVTGTCYSGGNVTRSFGIAAAPAATVNAPSDSYTSSCAYADQAAVTAAYNAWL